MRKARRGSSPPLLEGIPLGTHHYFRQQAKIPVQAPIWQAQATRKEPSAWGAILVTGLVMSSHTLTLEP